MILTIELCISLNVAGKALPTTTWNNDRSRLLISTTASTNTIIFPIDSIGRTNIQILSGNLLPLTINVNALLRGSVAEVAWQAYEQQDVANYVVEKSIDGLNFIHFVAKNATASINDNYLVSDASLTNGTNYYRVKIVYKNGEISYSKVVSVSYNRTSSIIVVPNPIVNNTITLKITGVKTGKYHLALIDGAGKIAASKSTDISNTTATVQWQLNSNLSRGNYHLVLSNMDGKAIKVVNLTK